MNDFKTQINELQKEYDQELEREKEFHGDPYTQKSIIRRQRDILKNMVKLLTEELNKKSN